MDLWDHRSWHKGSIKKTTETALEFYISYKERQRHNTNTQTQNQKEFTNDTSQQQVSNRILKNKGSVVAYLESGEYANCDLLKKYKESRYRFVRRLKKAIRFYDRK